jgi:hypothetical protein
VKCSECPNQEFVYFDESVIDHLEGIVTVGTYAIRPDDTCMFLAADFDKENWLARNPDSGDYDRNMHCFFAF